jgi:hypothetical protein
MRTGQIAQVLLMTAAVAFMFTACDDVTGGAVELSWRFRPEPGYIPDDPADPFVDCDSEQPYTSPIARMRLDWDVAGAGSSASWDCSAGNGVTRFDVPAGEALLTVTPECGSGDADPTTYIAPAPIERSVTVGDVVSLGAVELLLRIASCGSGANGSDVQPCICQDSTP